MASRDPLSLPEATDATTAWLLPGQGAQAVGMGKDLYAGSDAARDVFQTADRVLGYSLSEICFEGPEEKLRETEYTQPAIFTASLASLAASLESGRVAARPGFMAGHSLGEYSALVAAGSLTLEDGLRLLAERARQMAEAGKQSAGGMAAIMGLDEATVREICAEADIDVCNLNLPAQTVVGGAAERVERAVELAKGRGASRAQVLNVSGAFHSRLMQPAVQGLLAAIERTALTAPRVPVVANAGGTTLKTAEEVRTELGVQISRPVHWHESVTLMAAGGVQTYVEFGPGRVLTGLVKRLVPGAKLANVASLEDAREVAVSG